MRKWLCAASGRFFLSMCRCSCVATCRVLAPRRAGPGDPRRPGVCPTKQDHLKCTKSGFRLDSKQTKVAQLFGALVAGERALCGEDGVALIAIVQHEDAIAISTGVYSYAQCVLADLPVEWPAGR